MGRSELREGYLQLGPHRFPVVYEVITNQPNIFLFKMKNGHPGEEICIDYKLAHGEWVGNEGNE